MSQPLGSQSFGFNDMKVQLDPVLGVAPELFFQPVQIEVE